MNPTAISKPRSLVVLGIPFHDVTFEETVQWCVARMKSGPPACVATANLDFIMQATKDAELQRVLLESDLVLADGWPPVWLSGKLGPPLRQRVTGSDLSPMLAEAAAKEGLRVFLLGGGPGVAEKAGAELQRRYPGLILAGTYSPPVADVLAMNHDEILAKLAEAKPHLLLVAFGAPKQEKFINMHLPHWSVPLTVGVGGTLDFIAGAQTRAPACVQAIRMEWLWRMLTNPRRLAGRYFSNLAFLFKSVRDLNRLRTESIPVQPSDESWPNANTVRNLGGELIPWRPNLAAEGRSSILVLDLADFEWLDSEAQGQLVDLAHACRSRGGRLMIGPCHPRIRRLLQAYHLDAYFEVASSGADLLQKLSAIQEQMRNGFVVEEQSEIRVGLPVELTSANAQRFGDRVIQYLTTFRTPYVRMDASPVTFIDSGGMGVLIRIKKECAKRAGVCQITGWKEKPLNSLKLARVHTVLNDDLLAGSRRTT